MGSSGSHVDLRRVELGHHRSLRLRPLLGLLGIALPLAALPVQADVKGADGPRGLGTMVNGVRGGSCGAGLCEVSGGTRAGRNLFHGFADFNTRGGISGVRIQSDGFRNVMVGVMSRLGSFIDKPVSLSSKGNLFWLSPGGIQIIGAGSFQNVQHLQLSTATGLRFGTSGLWNVLSSTAEEVASLQDDPIRGSAGLLTDATALQELGLQANGDLSLDGGTLTVEESLLLDSQGGNVLLQAAGLQAPGGVAELSGRIVSLESSTLDVSNPSGVGGSALLRAEQLTLRSSRVDASGLSAGGQITLDAVGALSLQSSELLARGGGGFVLAPVVSESAPVELSIAPSGSVPDAGATGEPANAPALEDSTATTDQDTSVAVVVSETAAEPDASAGPAAEVMGSAPSAPSPVEGAAPVGLGVEAVASQPAAGPSAALPSTTGKGGEIILRGTTIDLTASALDASGGLNQGVVQQQAGVGGAWSYQLLSTTADVSPAIPASLLAAEDPQAETTQPLVQPQISAGVTTAAVATTQPVLMNAEASDAQSGGFIRLESRGGMRLSDASLQAIGFKGLGGDVRLEGVQLDLSGVVVDTSGLTGGGEILIGGGLQGADPTMANASQVSIDAATGIRSNAFDQGSGGTVVAYASDRLDVDGSFSARGGLSSGDGGFVETSSSQIYFSPNLKVSTKANHGKTGTWLIDPTDFTIDYSANSVANTLSAASVASSLQSTDFSILTAGSGSQNGDITVKAPIAWNGTGVLTLQADRNIVLGANITASGEGAGVVFNVPLTGQIQVNPFVGNQILISTQGDQIYQGNVFIPAGKTLAVQTPINGAGGIGFLGAIDGSGSLDVQLGSADGRVVFNSPVGKATALKSVHVGDQGKTYVNADVTTAANQIYENDVFLGVAGVGDFTNSGFDVAGLAMQKGFYSGLPINGMGLNKLSSAIPGSPFLPGWEIYLSPIVFDDGSLGYASTIDGKPIPLDQRSILDVKAGANSGMAQGGQIALANCYDNCAVRPGSVMSFSAQTAAGADGSGTSIELSSSGRCSSGSGYCIVNGPYIVSQGTVFLSKGDTVSFKWTASGGDDDFNVNAFLLDPVNGVTVPLLNSTGGKIPSAWALPDSSPNSIGSVVNGYNNSVGHVGQWSADTSGWVTSTVTLGNSVPQGNYKFVFASGTYDGTGGRVVGASMGIDSIDVSAPQPLNLFSTASLPGSLAMSASSAGASISLLGNVENQTNLMLSAPKAVQVAQLGGAGSFSANAGTITLGGDQLGSSSSRLALSGASRLNLNAVGDIYVTHTGSLQGLKAESQQAGNIDINVIPKTVNDVIADPGNLVLNGANGDWVRSVGGSQRAGGTIRLEASGSYSQLNALLDASTDADGMPGGVVYIDAGASIQITGKGSSSNYSIVTSGKTTGGSITVGRTARPVNGTSVSSDVAPSNPYDLSTTVPTVRISSAVLWADPPENGGSIAVNAQSISTINSGFNVTGTAGGSINYVANNATFRNVVFTGGKNASFSVLASNVTGNDIPGLTQNFTGIAPVVTPPSSGQSAPPPPVVLQPQPVVPPAQPPNPSPPTPVSPVEPVPPVVVNPPVVVPPAPSPKSPKPPVPPALIALQETYQQPLSTLPSIDSPSVSVAPAAAPAASAPPTRDSAVGDTEATSSSSAKRALLPIPQGLSVSIETGTSFEVFGDLQVKGPESLAVALLESVGVTLPRDFSALAMGDIARSLVAIFGNAAFGIDRSSGSVFAFGSDGSVVQASAFQPRDSVTVMLQSASAANADGAVVAWGSSSVAEPASTSASGQVASVVIPTQEAVASFQSGEQKSLEDAVAKLGITEQAGNSVVPTPQQVQAALVRIQQFVRSRLQPSSAAAR